MATGWMERARKRLGGRLLRSSLEGLARLSKWTPAARRALAEVEVVSDLAYVEGAGPERWLDVVRPRGVREPLPVVLYVHGGGFRILSKETHWLPVMLLARRGYVVFSINYRLAPRHPYPAALEDTCAAWLWVLSHAGDFGGDPARVVVAGESAGANLVTALTVACCTRREEPWAAEVFDRGEVPLAVMALCGILQVSDPGRFMRRRALPTWVKDRLLEVCEGYLGDRVNAPSGLADPLLVLESEAPFERPLPPFWAPCGTADALLDDTRRLGTALRGRDAECLDTYWPDEIHAFMMLMWRPAARQCWREGFAWLARWTHVGSHVAVEDDAEERPANEALLWGDSDG